MILDRFLNSETKTVSMAAGLLAVSAFLSRVLGLLRDALLSSTFGAGQELDVYFAAFRIPDLIYNILITGGVTVAFLPLFSEYFVKNKKDSWRFTNNVLNIFLFFLIFLSLIFFIFTEPLMKLITPGFNFEQLTQAIFLTRIMFLGPIFFGLSAIFSGILQYFNRFLIYSLCPILYNLGIIFGIIFLTPSLGILGVALGVILGAFFHFLIQVPSAINCGFRYQTIFNFKDLGIKKVFLLMLPRTFAVAGLQINFIIITAIASTLPAGSLSIFNFANNLQNFPVGILGVSFAVAVFPALSRAWAVSRKKEFIDSFSSAFRQTLYFIIPLSVLMFILRNQLVSVVLRHGQFSFDDAQLTAASLGLFSLGIFALSLIPLLSRVFFSLQDTKTPTLIVLIAMGLNIILSFYFVHLLQNNISFSHFLNKFFSLPLGKDLAVLGLPLAFSIGAIFHFMLLMIFLFRKIGNYNLKEIGYSSFKIILGGFLMIPASRLAFYFLDNGQTFLGAFAQAIIIGFIGIFVYFIITFLLNSPEIKNIKLKC